MGPKKLQGGLGEVYYESPRGDMFNAMEREARLHSPQGRTLSPQNRSYSPRSRGAISQGPRVPRRSHPVNTLIQVQTIGSQISPSRAGLRERRAVDKCHKELYEDAFAR